MNFRLEDVILESADFIENDFDGRRIKIQVLKLLELPSNKRIPLHFTK